MNTLRSLTFATAIFSSVCCVRADTVVTRESPPTATANALYVANRASGEWLEMDFRRWKCFNLVPVRQSTPRITAYKIQALADVTWREAFATSTTTQIKP